MNHQQRGLTSECVFYCLRLVLGALCTIATGVGYHIGYVHGATSITQTIGAGDLGTQVLLPIEHVYGITGGTSVGGNLYHSFAQLNVGTGDIAQFQTLTLSQDTAMLNILGRITDANPSTIFGTIDSAHYYPNANLFLMNPHGFLFGAGAMVNVGGMVAFTSADYLRLGNLDSSNADIFHADPAQARILTNAPVAAFGFLGSNPGAITVQGSQFTVTDGHSITLVGGNIAIQSGTLNDGTVQPARLSAPGGQINLASVISSGVVSVVDFIPTSGMTMGDINLSQGATIDVSGNAAGTVRIRGGQFVITDATISADTVNANGASTAVDIQLAGDLSISNDLVPAITARTTGSGEAGAVNIASANVIATSNTPGILTLIDTHTSGAGKAGKAGNVIINTGNFQVIGSLEGLTTFIDSGTEGSGHGGDVTIIAQNVHIDLSFINSGNFWANAFGEDVTGSAGNVNISTDSLNLTNSQIVTDAFSFANGTGQSGDITVTAHDISLDISQFSSQGHQRGGAITITTDHLFATDSQVIATSNLISGGGVTITGKSIELSTGSSVVSSTGGDGDAGPIHITATDHLGLLGAPASDRPSGIFSNSFGSFGSAGNAGDIVITTPKLEMTGGARINTTTATSGHGGNVTINAIASISMSGETGSFAPEPLFSLGGIQPSGIFTRTIGGNCSGPCGDAGNISITTGSLTVDTGGQINSGTSTSGHGGEITIHATDTISLSGTLSDGSPVGVLSRTIGTTPDAGSGGNVAISAGQSVTISNGASVSASSTGPGNTGNIQINAGNQFAMTNSSVTTEANQAGGGTIKITTTPSGTVELNNSTISASVLNGAGGGGSVNIDPLYVLLQNSQILAQAVQGPGGIITINITNGGLFLPDANSVISASSQFGVNGTITIQSPNAPISGHIQPLGKSPLIATSLLNQRCAALAGSEFSSFIVAGRDSLPTEPGSWLASPLYAANMGTGVKAEGVKAEGERLETPLLSLRQIAPAGFLTQVFAVEGSSSCQS